MLHKLINMHKIKFAVLETLLEQEYSHRDIVNIHIDLHSILADLYNIENYDESSWVENENSMIISSCIINLVAHYRLFFYSKYRASTRIFLYFANERPANNCEYYSKYGYKFFDKYSSHNEDFTAVNKEVSTNLKLCKTIAEYIPGVFYIDCHDIEPIVAACSMMIKYPETNLVITKDEYWYQCINILSPTNVLRLKRDDSYIVGNRNLYKTLLKNAKYMPKYMTPELLSVVYSFSGVKSRDVSGISGYGYSKIIKILDMAINRNLIKPTYTNIKNILDEIYSGDKEKELIDMFKAIDLRYQLNELTLAQNKRLEDCLKNRYNKKDLMTLNRTHYTEENTLMLDELFRGIDKIDDNFSW